MHIWLYSDLRWPAGVPARCIGLILASESSSDPLSTPRRLLELRRASGQRSKFFLILSVRQAEKLEQEGTGLSK